MSDRVEIKITGSNQTGPAFQGVVRDATQMGNAVEQSGTKASRSLEDLDRKAAAIGASIGAATMVLGEWSRAAAEDAAGQSRLQQSIENTGKNYDEYSDAVEKAIKAGQDKAFSDDATREALVRLNAVTSDTGASLDQLSLAMDFARARGISLASSAEIIAKVYGGNLGILSRYGIVLEEGATATEALARIQQISAGQAETYADSQLGQLDKMKDRWDELTESIGGSTGELQSFLMLLPGLTAGYTALAGVIGSLGGLKTLSTLGALGVGAGVAYLATDALMNQGATGSRASFTAANYGLYGVGSAINAVTPGNPIDTQKYMDTLASNAIEDVVKGLFYFSPTDSVGNRQLYDRLLTAGIVTGEAPEGSKGDKFIESQFLGIQRTAGQQGLTTGQFIEGQLSATGSSFVFDKVSGRWMDLGEYQIYQSARMKAANSATATGDIYGPAAPTWQSSTQPRGTGPGGQDIGYSASPRLDLAGPGGQPTGNSPFGTDSQPNYRATGRAVGYTAPDDSVQTSMAQMGAQSVQIAENATRALQAQYGAYVGLVDGIVSANDAQMAFKTTQDSLIGSQSVYSQQQSEYSSQLNALTAGYEILQQRQEEGQTLTKQEQDLLANYPGYYDRLTGGVEDATVAEALLAAQYAENMAIGDQMNATLSGTNDVLGTLAEALSLYILTLEGVPAEVRTELILNNDPALESLYGFLNLIPSSVTIPMYVSGTDIGNFLGGGNRLGGVVGYANGGTVMAELAEAGPELLHFRNGGSAWAMNRGVYNVPKGTYVDTAPASRLKAGGSGGVNNFYGPVTVIANNPQQFMDAMRESNIGGSRA